MSAQTEEKPKVRCSDCAFVHTFNPRPDEIERGLTMGCKYPDWEGYTIDDKPACGGVFFRHKASQ